LIQQQQRQKEHSKQEVFSSNAVDSSRQVYFLSKPWELWALMRIYFKKAVLLRSDPVGVMDFFGVVARSKTLPPSLEVISAQQRLTVLLTKG